MKLAWRVIALAALFGAVAMAQDGPKKISKGEALSTLATKIQPDYPIIARQLKIQGTVELEALVTERGEVTKVDIVSGNPVLTAAAVQAVKRWKFKPYLEEGKAVPILAPISLDFKL